MNQCGIKKGNIRITLPYQEAYFRAAKDNLRCDLMHGIRTYGNKIRPAFSSRLPLGQESLRFCSSLRQSRTGQIPVYPIHTKITLQPTFLHIYGIN